MFSMHKFANASSPHDSAAERGAARLRSLLARSSLGFFTSKRPPLRCSSQPAPSRPFAKDIQIAPEKERELLSGQTHIRDGAFPNGSDPVGQIRKQNNCTIRLVKGQTLFPSGVCFYFEIDLILDATNRVGSVNDGEEWRTDREQWKRCSSSHK